MLYFLNGRSCVLLTNRSHMIAMFSMGRLIGIERISHQNKNTWTLPCYTCWYGIIPTSRKWHYNSDNQCECTTILPIITCNNVTISDSTTFVTFLRNTFQVKNKCKNICVKCIYLWFATSRKGDIIITKKLWQSAHVTVAVEARTMYENRVSAQILHFQNNIYCCYVAWHCRLQKYFFEDIGKAIFWSGSLQSPKTFLNKETLEWWFLVVCNQE